MPKPAATRTPPIPALRTALRLFRFTLILLAVAAPPLAPAQSDLSAIAGTITDPTGALVPNAQVTLTSESTEAVHKTSTNRSGFYTISGLAPGRYTIAVESPGFERLTTTGNNLDPSIPSTINLTLTLGGASQQVTVEASETTLEADSATIGRVVTDKQIDSLPVNGRNPIYVALTKAGITSAPGSPVTSNASGSGSNLSSFNFSTGLGGIQINGGRERDNLVSYDGAVAVRIRASGDSVGVVDLDAVQEVQVLTANYPAEYGRSIGGQIRITTKSGGNQFHGSLYEYLQKPCPQRQHLGAQSHQRRQQRQPRLPQRAEDQLCSALHL